MMESYYDTIPNFRYWDIEAWKNYIKEYVVPIYKTTRTLLELRNELLPYVGKSLKTVKDNDERLLPFFVGGIDEKGNYKKRSLAKLIRLMFGIYVEPEEFVSAVNEEGERGFEVVKIKLINEQWVYFLRLIKQLNEYSSIILQKSKIEPQLSLKVSEILQDPNRLLDILKEFYKACVSFSANHNYYTFFIISTASIHWRYLVTAYPKLKEHFEKIREFLGLEPILIPNTNNKELRESYTIWGHEIHGIAYYIYWMQIILWVFFNFSENLIIMKRGRGNIYPAEIKEVVAYVAPEAEDLRRDYITLTENLLSQYNPPKIQELEVVEEYKAEIKGIFTLSPWNKRVMGSLPEFLDIVGPRLFLGLSKIMIAKEWDRDILIYHHRFIEHAEWWL